MIPSSTGIMTHPVTILGGNITATITGITASSTVVNGGGTVTASMANGLSATFFAQLTINTTGTQVLAANPNRLMGVWIQVDNNVAISAVIGDSFASVDGKGPKIAPPGTTNVPALFFIPGCGAVYAKAASALCNVSGFWF